jgi:hypothetical protein
MNKLLKLSVALIAASGIAFADTQLTDSISVGGFVDMSYTDGDNARESTSGIDQVEFDFSFDNGGKATAQVDIEYENGIGGVGVEEAYIDYALSDNAYITVGRFETMLLQDGSEPTDLYQYSNAYDFFGININAFLHDLGDQGIKYTNGNFAVSIVDNGDDKIGDGDTFNGDLTGDYSIELGYTAALSDNLTAFIGARMYEADAADIDGDLINVHLTYEEGPWVIGGEIAMSDAEAAALIPFDEELDLFQIFANYSYNENNSLTFRYSEAELSAEGEADIDLDKFTIAHNSALSHDLGMVIEYSMEDVSDGTDSIDQDVLAVELIYAF